MAEHSIHDDRTSPKGTGKPAEGPARERRSAHRVQDDQKSGVGAATALSKLKMMERKRAAMRPARDEDDD